MMIIVPITITTTGCTCGATETECGEEKSGYRSPGEAKGFYSEGSGDTVILEFVAARDVDSRH